MWRWTCLLRSDGGDRVRSDVRFDFRAEMGAPRSWTKIHAKSPDFCADADFEGLERVQLHSQCSIKAV